MSQEGLNSIGIARIIESAARVGKGEDEAGRKQIANAAAAVIEECDLEEEEKRSAIKQLKEAMGV